MKHIGWEKVQSLEPGDTRYPNAHEVLADRVSAFEDPSNQANEK
jgi:hypothetical protein